MLQTFGSPGKYFSPSSFLLHYFLSENLQLASQRNNRELEELLAGPRRPVLRLRNFRTAHAYTFPSADPELCQKKEVTPYIV